MNQQKEYYAFISYKREDEKWAKWLQGKLEHYRFPTNLNGRTDLPKNIRPTFRDVTDLKPGLLAEEINNALRNSEWLIVVCSPRSAKSPWVCKEAQTFIDLGREDHIIPFVIEGNPFSSDTATECYPEALLNLTGSKELLAANINEMGRDAAAIKVVARMFNLRFDALWQRYEREQRRKKRMWIGGSMLLALLGLGIGAYFVKQNRTIENQNIQLENAANRLREDSVTLADHVSRIQADSVQLVRKNDSIKKQKDSLILTNKLLTEERNNVLIANLKINENYSKIVAKNASKEIKKGNVYASVLALLELCSKHNSEQLLPELESVLREAYDSLCSAKWTYRLIDSHIENEAYMSNSEKYIVVSNGRQIILYDFEKLTVLYRINLPQEIKESEYRTYLSIDEKILYIAYKYGVFCFDINNMEIVDVINNNEVEKGKQIVKQLYRAGKNCNISDPFSAICGYQTPVNNWALSLFELSPKYEVLDYCSVNNYALLRLKDSERLFLFDCHKKHTIQEISFSPSNCETIGEYSDCSFSLDGESLVLSHNVNGSLIFDIEKKTYKYFDCGECHHYSNWLRFSNSKLMLHSSRTISKLDIIDMNNNIIIDSIIPQKYSYVWDAYLNKQANRCLLIADNDVYMYYKNLSSGNLLSNNHGSNNTDLESRSINLGKVSDVFFNDSCVQLNQPIVKEDTIINGRFHLTVSDDGVSCVDMKKEYKYWSHDCHYGSDIVGFTNGNRYIFVLDHDRWNSFLCVLDLKSGVTMYKEEEQNIWHYRYFNYRTNHLLFQNYDASEQLEYNLFPIDILLHKLKTKTRGMTLNKRERQVFFE